MGRKSRLIAFLLFRAVTPRAGANLNTRSRKDRETMIIPKESHLSPEQEAELESITKEFGINLMKITGETRQIFLMIGDERNEEMISRITGLEYIDRVDMVMDPYKLMARTSSLATHRVRLNGNVVGDG